MVGVSVGVNEGCGLTVGDKVGVSVAVDTKPGVVVCVSEMSSVAAGVIAGGVADRLTPGKARQLLADSTNSRAMRI
jgi:tRNA(Ile2) C34 agmatinyltransferase TiaS